jgi:hypothetical protein
MTGVTGTACDTASAVAVRALATWVATTSPVGVTGRPGREQASAASSGARIRSVGRLGCMIHSSLKQGYFITLLG